MSTSALDDLFGALADPTRRLLFRRLVEHGPQTATHLTAGSSISRQAIVKHLQALTDAGLAAPERCGREVRYAATPERLATVIAWLTESSSAWDARISRLISKNSSVSPPGGTPSATRR